MTRRGLLLSALAAPAVSRLRAARLEIFQVRVNRRGNWVLARVSTADGLSGLGDASHGGRDERTIGYLKQFFALLQTRTLADIEWLRQAVAPEVAGGGRPAAVAFSALEQCIWDIRGKALGAPVYELLGGALRTRIRNYANINRSTPERDPAGFAAMAEKLVAAGFDAAKLAPFDDMPPKLTDPAGIGKFTRAGIECAAAVRKVLGPGRDLLIDVHSRYNRERGLDLARRFEPLNLFWLEEVVPLRDIESLAAINRAAAMPTAGGEALFGAKGFYPYIAAGAFDILMPDIKYCGGLLELKKIAAMAEAAGLPVSPHGPASPVGNAAAAQVCATLPNFLILEYAFGEVPWRAELIDPPEQLDRGCLAVSGRPGFGIVLNEKTAARYAV
ncbi:MAG: mandelate racemase/muconate lactonizing enzyme family protein [Bryobacterales bacterium]|nr:mandelate racemase/muconate lactonizing enzyme family protein [Bryobacterales bacterium]